MMEILFCRHGQASSNVGPVFDSLPPGGPLTPQGREQARRLSQRIVEPGDEISAVFASDLVRASQTAEAVAAAAGVEVQTRKDLREWNAGRMEGKGDQRSLDAFFDLYQRWTQGAEQDAIEGGERATDVIERMDGVVREVESLGGTRSVIVSHGVAIRLWVGYRTTNLEPSYVMRELGNCGVVRVRGDSDEGWEMVSWTEGNVLTW